MVGGAISYHEPGITTILIHASFLLLLNVVGAILDHLFYCGLVGQVLIGMAWGTPGAMLLSESFEETVMQLGYLGLILVVFEGGLSTSVRSIADNLYLSLCVALTGISVPMALSFALRSLGSATNIQCFAAGAALCSTSLGTTFSLLKTTGLTQSRLGVVLTTAAMLDDVVGLILVQIVTNLGTGRGSIEAQTIIRPVFVSLGFAVISLLICRYILAPLMGVVKTRSNLLMTKNFTTLLSTDPAHLVFSTMFLLSMITAASYAGTSVLFAAYLAGASISWLNGYETNQGSTDVTTQNSETPSSVGAIERLNSSAVVSAATPSGNDHNHSHNSEISGCRTQAALESPRRQQEPTPPPDLPVSSEQDTQADVPELNHTFVEIDTRSMLMYECYYAMAAERILKPFFFVSEEDHASLSLRLFSDHSQASIGFSIPISRMFHGPTFWRGLVYSVLMTLGKMVCGLWLVRFYQASRRPKATPSPTGKSKSFPELPRPKSLYPAAILGCAMVARGEIGFLISAVANSNGVFGPKTDSEVDFDIFLVVTWAILLCTVIGPITLGCLAKRVRKVQQQDGSNAGREDPLGVWGLVQVETRKVG